ncbi:MAG: FtsX-like permease family protein [Rhodocyclaceae bacterium]|nr:MAG: FtsX-like permease family protein [Rhodocyclaceae bacterium]
MLRMLRRDWRAGELTVLGLALAVAVASLTSVGFLTDRVGQALIQESHQLLGGDLLLTADHPWSETVRREAAQGGLNMADSASFPSMVSVAGATQLAEVKAVSTGYPLRGALRIAPALNLTDAEVRGIPARGTVWLDERLTAALNVRTGDEIVLGSRRFSVAAVLTLEPDRGVNVFAIAPRLLMHLDDLPGTALIQPGSRVSYRLHLAGDAVRIATFNDWAKPQLGRGERLEDLSNSRPEIRTMLERAQRFLRLAALLAVVLAAVAVGFAADRYMRRHLDACAVMRCLGARASQVLAVHGGEFLLFGLVATLSGCLAGYAVQWGLQGLLAGLLLADLPAPSWQPWAHGLLVGMVLVAGFAAPPLLRLQAVSTLRVLRREWASVEPLSLTAYVFGCVALAALMMWIAGELLLGTVVIVGFAAALGLYALLARSMLILLGRLGLNPAITRFPGLRLGLANLRRHAGASVLQAIALGLGLTALLLLTVARQDLLESWRAKVPADAPNRFIINIQPEQRLPLADFFKARHLTPPRLEPMVRGRLVAVNERPITAKSYEDERAQRLVDREFNLSWSELLPEGNNLTAGRWHGAGTATKSAVTEFSVEQGLAETLRLALGDRLSYEIAGQRLEGNITSLRKLDWDSMRVNFFVMTPPAVLERFPGTDITSFHLPADRAAVINELVRDFPNLTVIDVGVLVRQLQATLDQVARAVQVVFGFALLAGLMVLYAALQASYDERRYELALLRALGARSRQLRGALLAEFALLGGIAGLLAGIGAAGISWALARWVFRLNYLPDGWMLPLGLALGALGIALAGWLGTAPVLKRPALESLRGD